MAHPSKAEKILFSLTLAGMLISGGCYLFSGGPAGDFKDTSQADITEDIDPELKASENAIVQRKNRGNNPLVASDNERTAPKILEQPLPGVDKRPTQPLLESSPSPIIWDQRKSFRWSFWGGLGGNYLKFEQSGTDTLDSGTFASVKAPSMSAGIEFKVTEQSKVSLEYHDLPGEVKAQSDQVLGQSNYHWRSLIGEWQYQVAGTRQVNYSLLLGAQNHQIPLLNVYGNNTLDLLSYELRTISVGGKIGYISESNYEYEVSLRYQSLIGSRSLDKYEFSAQSKLIFDGFISVYRRLSNHLKFGLNWSGQYQDVTYDFSQDGASSSGHQNLFISNLQVRLIYEFGDN